MPDSDEHDVERLLSSPFFCVKPWVHCHVTTDGELAPCAISTTRFGRLRDSSLATLWHAEGIRRFRSEQLAREPHPNCKACYEAERAGAVSMRLAANREFGARAADWIRGTDAQGNSSSSRPVDYDIRFSNVCNFKCRSCYQGASSRWYSDHVALYGKPDRKGAIVRAFEDSGEFWRAFGGFIDDLEALNFAGGEPLLQKEHYQIMEALRERERFGVALHYITNFSVLDYQGIDVPRLWQAFEHVDVAASLDASGARGELLRHGQSWAKVLVNRERLRRQCPHVKFRVMCSVSALNVWHLPDFHRELIETGFIEPDQIQINLVQYPVHLGARVLTSSTKGEVADRLRAHMDWLHSLGAVASAEQIRTALQYMVAEDLSEYFPALVRYCRALDRLRNEDTLATFPEFADVRLPKTKQGVRLKIAAPAPDVVATTSSGGGSRSAGSR
jgi:sulfatase maturation enzyme AslB (radical SAM superfamily)